MIAAIPMILKPSTLSKEDYLNLLKSFSDLFTEAQRNGLLSIEKHVEEPTSSEILSKNEKFINDEVAVNFFCDNMKVLLGGGIQPADLEHLIDSEIETFEAEFKPVGAAFAKVADALPGIGIVAAVLGIIVTMSSIDQGAEAVGHHVAAALVGTFLGVLLSYGFVNPLATKIESMFENRARYLTTIKTCIVSIAKGNPPLIAVEMARRTIYSESRPTFVELENFVRNRKK
jgi:chemotaxis protein MotA